MKGKKSEQKRKEEKTQLRLQIGRSGRNSKVGGDQNKENVVVNGKSRQIREN